MEEINFSKYLNSPKSIDELKEKLEENDMDWNKDQLKLYLTLNKKIEKDNDKWKIGEVSKEEQLLNFIREKLDEKNIVRLDKLVDQLPYNLPATTEELYNLAKSTDDLTCPNSNVVTKE